jgi:hypothetical protein
MNSNRGTKYLKIKCTIRDNHVANSPIRLGIPGKYGKHSLWVQLDSKGMIDDMIDELLAIRKEMK